MMTETFLCSVCGEAHPLEDRREFDDQDLCARCLEEETVICHECGSRYFGVELEVDEGGESNSSAEALLQIVNAGEERAYCKHDGSLEDGFEIVTHPMTLAYHLEAMPWEALLHRASEMGYLSHKALTCGFHIHVNRDTFGETEAQQDACIARILYFFEKHWDELLKFSRRTPHQLEQWASRYGYKDRPM